jgi:hypothetical protein
MKFSIVLKLAIVIIFFSGCATTTPIQKYSESISKFNVPPRLMSHNFSDNDIYRNYQRAATGFTSIESLRYDVEKRAELFASRQNKSIIVLGERISEPPYILGNFPRIEIVFALIDKKD